MTEQTKPTMARKVVQDANLATFVAEVVSATQNGWTIDDQNPPNLFGYIYEVHLLKDENLIDKSVTRADIAANARSAKKLKAEEKAAAGTTSESRQRE